MTAAPGGTDPAFAQLAQESLGEMSPASIGVLGYLVREKLGPGESADLFAHVHLVRALIQHALSLAETLAEQAIEYRTAAVPLTYNLAADTWSGWGLGAAIAEPYRKLGMEAARLNTELALDVGLGPERRKNGFWILGAHLIAAGRVDDAISAFERSRELAIEAGDATSALMAKGWVHLASVVGGRVGSEELDAIKRDLEALGEAGKLLAAQYEPALKQFS